MQHNNRPQKLLVKGWLLPHNRRYYRFKTNAFLLESLPMLLNMWVALASERLKFDEDNEQTMADALTLIVSLDQQLMEKSKPEAGQWLSRLRTNDDYYISYYNRLLELVKEAIALGKYAELNGCIQNTWEYKQWMQEAGYLLATPILKDGWLHPLSEFTTIDGEEVMNDWAVASLLAAAATGRNECGDKQTCTSHLIRLGVLDMQTDINTRLKVACFMDAEYLEIVCETKEALVRTAQNKS